MNSKTPTVNSIGALSASSWRHGGLVLACVALLACAGKSAGSSADATPGGDTAGSLADDAGASGSDSGAVGDTAGSDPVDVAGGDSADDDVVLAKDLPCVDLAKVKPGTPCDDGDPCTSVDQCHGGKCRGVVDTCMDGDVCTEDKCDKGTCTFVVVNDSLGCGKADVPNPVPELGEWPAEAAPARQYPPLVSSLKDGSLLLLFPCHAVRTTPTWKWLWTFDLPKFVGRPGQGTHPEQDGGFLCDTSSKATGYGEDFETFGSIADATETPGGGFLLLGHGDGSKPNSWDGKPKQWACGGEECLITWVLALSASGKPIGDRRPLLRRKLKFGDSWNGVPWPMRRGAITRVDRDRYLALYQVGEDDSNLELAILRASGDVVATRVLELPSGKVPKIELPHAVMWGLPGSGGTVSWSLQPNGLVVRTGADGGILNLFEPGPFPAMAFAMSDGRILVRRPLESPPVPLTDVNPYVGKLRQLTIAKDWATLTHDIVVAPYYWTDSGHWSESLPYHMIRNRVFHDPIRKIDFTPTFFQTMGLIARFYAPATSDAGDDWVNVDGVPLRTDRELRIESYYPVEVQATCHNFLDPSYPQCKESSGPCRQRVVSDTHPSKCPLCYFFKLDGVPCGEGDVGLCDNGECKLPVPVTP